MRKKTNNILAVFFTAGLALMVFASGGASLFGAALVFISVIVFAAGSFFKENTGNPVADLTEAMNQLGGEVLGKNNTATAEIYRIGDSLRFTR